MNILIDRVYLIPLINTIKFPKIVDDRSFPFPVILLVSDINIKFNCLHLINSLILFSEASITRTFPNSNLSLKLFHPRIAHPSFYTRQARGTHEHRAPINFPFINKLLRSDKSRVEITKSSRVSSVARDPAPPPCALYRKFNPCCRQASSFKLESCDDSPCKKQVNRFIRFNHPWHNGRNFFQHSL